MGLGLFSVEVWGERGACIVEWLAVVKLLKRVCRGSQGGSLSLCTTGLSSKTLDQTM